eukprot:Pgem_evm1s2756
MPCPIKTGILVIASAITVFNKFKTTKAYSVLYYMMMFMLLLLHIELFTGGKICRMLFVKTNESDINAIPQPITAVPNPFRI